MSARRPNYLNRSQSPMPNPSTTPNQATSNPNNPREFFTTNSITNIPPLPSDPNGLYSILVTDQDLLLAKKKYVKVTGSSEIEVEPDHINFVIQIKSTKPDIRDARASVRKREDYVVNVLKKHFIPESSYKIVEFVEKVRKTLPQEDSNHNHLVDLENNEAHNPLPETEAGPSRTKIPIQQFDIFKLTKEINVNIENLLKYLQIFSICTEKLDEQVLISQPIVKFSSGLLQTSTQKAIRKAMINSQAKAVELVGNCKHQEGTSPAGAHLALGPLMYSSEDSLTIQSMKEYENTCSYFETFKWKRFNKIINCQITSAFEIVHVKPKRYI